MTDKLPADINLEARKVIIRDELRKLLGKPIPEQAVIEKRRLKRQEFEKNKIRRKLADKARRRNRM